MIEGTLLLLHAITVYGIRHAVQIAFLMHPHVRLFLVPERPPAFPAHASAGQPIPVVVARDVGEVRVARGEIQGLAAELAGVHDLHGHGMLQIDTCDVDSIGLRPVLVCFLGFFFEPDVLFMILLRFCRAFFFLTGTIFVISPAFGTARGCFNIGGLTAIK